MSNAKIEGRVLRHLFAVRGIVLIISAGGAEIMAKYIHQLPNWPKFQWNERALASPLAALRHRQGRFVGRMEALGFPQRNEAMLQTLTQDVVKSSEIEGEILDN